MFKNKKIVYIFSSSDEDIKNETIKESKTSFLDIFFKKSKKNLKKIDKKNVYKEKIDNLFLKTSKLT